MSEQVEQLKARADGHEGVKLRGIREMRCESNTLNYPPAAWFALACAMVVFNVLGVVKAALRSAHGGEVQAKLSSHAMATHMRSMAQRLNDIVEPEDWRVLNEVSTPEMAQRLLEQTALMPLKHYTKTPARKIAPMPAVKRAHDPKKPHVSLANPPPKALEHRSVQQRPNHNLLDKYNPICKFAQPNLKSRPIGWLTCTHMPYQSKSRKSGLKVNRSCCG